MGCSAESSGEKVEQDGRFTAAVELVRGQLVFSLRKRRGNRTQNLQVALQMPPNTRKSLHWNFSLSAPMLSDW